MSTLSASILVCPGYSSALQHTCAKLAATGTLTCEEMQELTPDERQIGARNTAPKNALCFLRTFAMALRA